MSDLIVWPVTAEHHREPLGIGDTRPRLSWVVRTELPDWRQAAYELEVEPADGRVWTVTGARLPRRSIDQLGRNGDSVIAATAEEAFDAGHGNCVATGGQRDAIQSVTKADRAVGQARSECDLVDS